MADMQGEGLAQMNVRQQSLKDHLRGPRKLDHFGCEVCRAAVG